MTNGTAKPVSLSESKHWSYDVVIIGAGIGGLISGIELAANGLRTLILERHFQPGGCCSSFQRKGFTFDAGAHLLGGVGNKRVLIGNYLAKLNLDLHYLQPDPWDIITFPDRVIKIPADAETYIADLSKRYPREARIEAFFRTMKKILISFSNPKSPTLEKYSEFTYQEMLDEFFEDPSLKSVLSAQWGYLGALPNEISAIAMCAMLNSYFFCGAFFPRGGSGAFARALADKFQQLGGTIKYSRTVKKITVKEGRVSGVVADRGDEFHSGYVISNGDARHTFCDLVGEDNVDSAYLDRIKRMKSSISLFITYLGLDMRREEIAEKHGWYFESAEMNCPENSPLFVTTPSVFDPELAPPGKNIVQLYSIAPGNIPLAGITREQKADWEATILKKAEKIFPRVVDRIVVKESATPKTIHRYTLNSHGAVYGWSPVPAQSWKNNLSNATPVKGLYLAGHWSYPGTGVMSVISSGLNASKKVMNEMRTESWR